MISSSQQVIDHAVVKDLDKGLDPAQLIRPCGCGDFPAIQKIQVLPVAGEPLFVDTLLPCL
jgi:hypothetical protein